MELFSANATDGCSAQDLGESTVSQGMTTLDTAEQLPIHQTPTTETWAYQPMYKENIRGKVLVWQIGFNGTHLVIHHGHANGKLIPDKVRVDTNQSGRTLQEQALLEARSRINDKIVKDGYAPAGLTKSTAPNAMLAQKWKPDMITHWPVAVQDKVDGVRMIVSRQDNSIVFRSRNNRTYRQFAHLIPEIERLLAVLPYGCYLDGEGYNPLLPFEVITSIARTTKTLHPLITEYHYYVFDIHYYDDTYPDSLPPYEERYRVLEQAFTQLAPQLTCVFLLSYALAYSDIEILDLHSQAIEGGSEGIIIRRLANDSTVPSVIQMSQYKSGRSRHILKYKEFEDEEALIVGVEAPRGREEQAALLQVQDSKGAMSTIRTRGTLEMRGEWLLNPSLVVGRYVTVRHQGLTDYGVWKFPVGVAIRDYE